MGTCIVILTVNGYLYTLSRFKKMSLLPFALLILFNLQTHVENRTKVLLIFILIRLQLSRRNNSTTYIKCQSYLSLLPFYGFLKTFSRFSSFHALVFCWVFFDFLKKFSQTKIALRLATVHSLIDLSFVREKVLLWKKCTSKHYTFTKLYENIIRTCRQVCIFYY